MKKTIMLIVVFLIIAVLLFISKNLIAKTAVTGGVKAVTGLQMDIDSMEVGIIKTIIGVSGIRLYNPPDFAERTMMDMPEIYVNYDLSAFLKRQAHLEELRINLRDFTVIRGRDGELNINSLKVVKDKKDPEESKKESKVDVKIDLLDLKIGSVAYKDFSNTDKPETVKYDLNVHEKFYNITDLNEIARIILFKSLMNTDIGNLINFDMDLIKTELADTLKKAPEIGKPVQEAGEKTKKAVEEATKDIKKKLKLPFGRQ
jgi:hypothetical protein